MSSSVRRIVLTGGTGFIGTQAISALQACGYEVHALGRRQPFRSMAFHQFDLLDANVVWKALFAIRASQLLHLARYAERGLYWQSPATLNWVAATLALVRVFRESGGIRAMTASTCAEYAWGPERLREDGYCAPATPNSATKDGTRRTLAAYAREIGLSFARGRLFFLSGPGEKSGPLVSDTFKALTSGEHFATRQGHQQRDFSLVTDVAEAFAALVDTNVAGLVNIGSGAAVPVRTILERMSRLSGRLKLIDFGARQLAKSELPTIGTDVARPRDEVGFYPSYDLDTGHADTLAASTQTREPAPEG